MNDQKEYGRRGGTVLNQKYGREHFERIGKKGGDSTKSRHGSEHYKRIGRIGGLKSKRGNHEQASAEKA